MGVKKPSFILDYRAARLVVAFYGKSHMQSSVIVDITRFAIFLRIRYSLVVRMRRSHRRDRGSIPRSGTFRMISGNLRGQPHSDWWSFHLRLRPRTHISSQLDLSHTVTENFFNMIPI